VELIRRLKPGYRIYAISNVDRETADYAIRKYSSIYGLFDGHVFSFEVGMAKPEKGIYLLALRKFRLKPEECVYIDNQPENLPPAQGIGIKSIKFQGAEKLKQQLKNLGVKF